MAIVLGSRHLNIGLDDDEWPDLSCYMKKIIPLICIASSYSEKLIVLAEILTDRGILAM